jgi:cytochrome o ubiquinol oxidase subunit 2
MSGKTHPRFFNLLSICAPLLLGGCKATLLDPKGQVGVDEKSLILTSVWLMLIVVVPVIVLTVIFAYKYRASNTKSTYLPDWSHSTRIEVVVWAVPCAIILALSILTWTSTHDLDPFKPLKSKVKPITIDVVALDWKWLFIYPEQHVASVNELAFPANVPVNFRITSDSVMNSFFIPQIGSQIYAMAGMESQVNLIANEAGVYDGLSANFSGPGFSNMRFKALASSQADFDAWVAKARKAGNKLDAANYPALAKPSQNMPVTYYASVDPGLFHGIIAKYMLPVYVKAPTTMPMKMSMNGMNMN